MKKHKFISELENKGAKVTSISYNGQFGFKIKGFDVELNGKTVEIQPIQRRLGIEYFVTWGNGKSNHYTKRSNEGFLPAMCNDMKAFKNDIINFLNS